MKEFLGLIGAVIALTAYTLYFRDIFRRRIKPHAFSWLVWGLLAGIGFAAQIVGHAGAGSWVLGVDVILCTCIFLLALFIGERGYTRSDWIALLLAVLAMFLWWASRSPLLSVFLITLADFFGFIPTFRKSYGKPHEESATMFALSALKFIFALPALETYSIITAFYPAALVCMNGSFVFMLLMRRRQLHTSR